jgi:putative sterol carrier protein
VQKLVAESANVLAYNADNKKWEHPKVVYEKLVCHLVECEDIMANKIAFSDNDQAVGIGDACTAAFVRKLTLDGLTSHEIMYITGKKESWLRDEEAIIALDDECFESFATGEINRTIALELIEIEDVNQRHAKLKQIKEYALTRFQVKIVVAEEAVSSAEAKIELLSANIETADTAVEKAVVRAELIEAQVVAEKKHHELKVIKGQKPKGTSKDLQAMQAKPVSLTLAKIVKHWEGPLHEFLQAGDFTEIPEKHIRLAMRLCVGIKEGNSDIKSILLLNAD